MALRSATGSSSSTLSEARHRALEFFRQVCRQVPSIMERYNIDEEISKRELRSKVASEFRKHANVTNPKVVDMLVYKGEEDLMNHVIMAKQRHHIISQWLVPKEGSVVSFTPATLAPRRKQSSEFLEKFFESNSS